MFYVVETANFWFLAPNGTRVSNINNAKKFTNEHAAKLAAQTCPAIWGCKVREFRGV